MDTYLFYKLYFTFYNFSHDPLQIRSNHNAYVQMLSLFQLNTM